MDSLTPVRHTQHHTTFTQAEEYTSSNLAQLSTSAKQKGKRKVEQILKEAPAKDMKAKKTRSGDSQRQPAFAPRSFVALICNPILDTQRKAIVHMAIREYDVAKTYFLRLLQLNKSINLHEAKVSTHGITDKKLIKKISKCKNSALSLPQILDRLGFISLQLQESEQARNYFLESYNLKKAIEPGGQENEELFHTIDSLRKISVQLKDDQAAHTYLEEGRALLLKDPNAQQALTKERASTILKYLIKIANDYFNEGSYLEANPYFQKALSMLNLTDPLCIAEAIDIYKRLGDINFELDLYDEAKVSFENALVLLDQEASNQNGARDHQSMIYAYHQLGNVFYKLKDYAEAKRCFLAAIGYLNADLKKIDYNISMLITQRLGKTYYRLGQYEDAKLRLEEAMKLFSQISEAGEPPVTSENPNPLLSFDPWEAYEDDIIDTLNAYGKVVMQLDSPIEAMQSWKKAIAILEKKGAADSLLGQKIKLRLSIVSAFLRDVNGSQELIEVIKKALLSQL